MNKQLLLGIIMMGLLSPIMGCKTISKTEPMGSRWIAPPQIDPFTKQTIGGLQLVTFEQKSRDPYGQDIVTQRAFLLNHSTLEWTELSTHSSSGEGIVKGAVHGMGFALVDGILDIPEAAVFGASIRPARSETRVNSGNTLSSSGGNVDSGAVQNSVNTSASANPTANGGKIESGAVKNDVHANAEGGKGGLGGQGGRGGEGGKSSSSSNARGGNGGQGGSSSADSTARGGNATGGNSRSGSSSSSDSNSHAGSNSNSNSSARQKQGQGQEQGQEASGYGGDASSGGGGWHD